MNVRCMYSVQIAEGTEMRGGKGDMVTEARGHPRDDLNRENVNRSRVPREARLVAGTRCIELLGNRQ
jgi:hypothetical protein